MSMLTLGLLLQKSIYKLHPTLEAQILKKKIETTNFEVLLVNSISKLRWLL